jgi:hypothetical protein
MNRQYRRFIVRTKVLFFASRVRGVQTATSLQSDLVVACSCPFCATPLISFVIIQLKPQYAVSYYLYVKWACRRGWHPLHLSFSPFHISLAVTQSIRSRVRGVICFPLVVMHFPTDSKSSNLLSPLQARDCNWVK